MGRMGDVVVVGAGIGGLTAAVAFARRGWSVTVLERAESLEPVGAGIALAPNAVRALDAVGLADDVRAMAALSGEVGLRRPDGAWLVKASADEAAGQLDERPVLLHRAQLVGLLADALPDGALRLGARVVRVEPGDRETRARVTIAPTEALEADLVVAADGIDSPTRAALFPTHPGPTYTGVTAWRFVTHDPVPVQPAETWGRGSIVGLTPLADGRVYCYLTAVLPEGTRFGDEADELRRRFAGWHDPIPALLDGLDPADVLHHDLRWLATPLPRFDVGRVALVGDAAHAMPPNLGQGGCQALEDAVTLAAFVEHGPDIRTALSLYSVTRVPRTTKVARMSARVGAPSAWTGRSAVALRDLGMRLTGPVAPRMAMRQLRPVLDWRPPA